MYGLTYGHTYNHASWCGSVGYERGGMRGETFVGAFAHTIPPHSKDVQMCACCFPSICLLLFIVSSTHMRVTPRCSLSLLRNRPAPFSTDRRCCLRRLDWVCLRQARAPSMEVGAPFSWGLQLGGLQRLGRAPACSALITTTDLRDDELLGRADARAADEELRRACILRD